MLKISLYVLLVFALCGRNESKSIVVIGIAENLKAGAAVISESDDKMYYVDGVDSWGDEILGKRIKVKGKLRVKEMPPPEKGELKQSIVGTVRMIKKPKWKILM
jgi:hypothetical protein